MTIKPAEYPLSWPEGHGRHTPATRVPSRFKTSIAGALKNIRTSLVGFEKDSRIKVSGIVISTNATLTTHRPDDPGVAVWFQWDGAYRCFAVDIYRTVAENMQAIHHVIEADRTKIRHAGVVFFRAHFKPSADIPLLPAPAGARPWRDVIDAGELNGSTSRIQINARWRRLMKAAGEDEARKRELNAAREAGFAEIPADA